MGKSNCTYLHFITALLGSQLAMQARGTTLYDFGNPNGQEQFNLELINRARANPPAEGARLAAETDQATIDSYTYFGVNLAVMQSEFNAISATPPLAPNKILAQVAKNHSNWMLTNALQEHDELPGVAGGNFGERVQASGYNYYQMAENIFAYGESVRNMHASFEVDWGADTNGMLTGRGHRVNLHNPAYREIGIGIVNGSHLTVGPELITHDLGVQQNTTVYATGVAYYDLNGNNFYDEGEGLPNLTVTATQSGYHCYTAEGGGWSLPLANSSGARTITWQCTDLNATANVTVKAALDNVKADLKLAYTPPQWTGPNSGTQGLPLSIPFTGVPGISQYLQEWWTAAPAAAENAENTSMVVMTQSTGYSVLNTVIKQQGASSFHLAHAQPQEQIIELNQNFYGTATAAVNFQSRLRTATSDQQARLEILPQGESVWQALWTQNGSNSSGETAFNLRSASLAAMNGKIFRIRFRYAFSFGSYYNGTNDTTGWFVDAINLPNVLAVDNYQSSLLTGTTAVIPATTTGSLVVNIAPKAGDHFFPGSVRLVTLKAPTGFMAWAMTRESAAGLPPGSLALAPGLDKDKDGATNLMEYAYNLNPLSSTDAAAALPKASVTAGNFTFDYSVDTGKTDLNYRPEAKIGASSVWVGTGEVAGFTDTLLTTVGAVQKRRASLPVSSASRVLFRLAVQLK